MPDHEAVELATAELDRIGLIDPSHVTNGVKVRVPDAYPMYDSAYREAVAEIRGYLEHFQNLRTFGRNGLHRYNNQDHSMWTAMLATRNHLDGTSHDVWSVNTKAEYLEEGSLAERLLDEDFVNSKTPAARPSPPPSPGGSRRCPSPRRRCRGRPAPARPRR